MNTSSLKLIRLKKQDWNILVTADNIEQALEKTKDIVAFIDSVDKNTEEVIRNDKRSFVATALLHGKNYIVKSPRDKNRRKWTRFTTLFIAGEAFRTISSLALLKGAGVNVPTPLIALEKRKYGVVVDSWIIYEYIKADTTSPDFDGIIEQLNKIHAAGRVHADSGKQNFISSNGRVFAIDCRTRKKLWGRISECYDFVLLENSDPEALGDFGCISSSLSFKLAKIYNNAVRGWRRLKKKIRNKEPLSKAEKKTRKTFFKYIQYLVLVMLSQFLRPLSHETIIKLGNFFGELGFRFLSKSRNLGIANIRKVLKCDEATALPVVRKAFSNAARIFLEIPYFYYNPDILKKVPVHGISHLRKSLKQGRGVVGIAGHIGNWDALGHVMSEKNTTPTAIARKQHNPYIDNWISRVRKSFGVNVIYQGRSVSWNKKIIRTLKANNTMYFIMDQYISGGLKAEFCGYKVPTPTGAYRMAKIYNSPVHLIYMLMNDKGKYEAYITPEIEIIEKEDRDEEMLENTNLFNRRLEEVIKANPDQWLCFHKRFRKCTPLCRRKDS